MCINARTVEMEGKEPDRCLEAECRRKLSTMVGFWLQIIKNVKCFAQMSAIKCLCKWLERVAAH